MPERFPELDIPVADADVDGAPRILVGPVQRYRDTAGRATVFLEVERPCEVEIRTLGKDTISARCPTWTVHGHHYALVLVDGLPVDTAVAYEVALDGTVCWPPPDSTDPPSVFAPAPTGDRLRISFGSCRELGAYDETGLRTWGPDALVALANHLRTVDHEHWPHLILHLGDQVYADEPSSEIAERLRALHAGEPEEVREEIRDFEEYTWLYQTTWSHEDVRWLLATVPSAMILDDHDLRDDWNTSKSWREEMETRPWWRDRVVGALASYWVYQHIGNLSPAELEVDATYQAVIHASAAEATRILDEFAWRADAEPDSARWSFARALGPTRLVVIDARCSRVLDPPEARAIVDGVEWTWLREQALASPMPRHVIVASTLPVFLPYGIHHIEGWSEAIATGVWGRVWARIGEKLRRAIDFEHWAAYHRSFVTVVDLLQEIVARDDRPSSVLFLSGDVHFSYTARVELLAAAQRDTQIHQLVQSPMRNSLPRSMMAVFWFLQTKLAAHLFRPLARLARVKHPPVRWLFDGPLSFANGVMTVMIDADAAAVAVDRARIGADGREGIDRTAVTALAPPGPAGRRRPRSGRLAG